MSKRYRAGIYQRAIPIPVQIPADSASAGKIHHPEGQFACGAAVLLWWGFIIRACLGFLRPRLAQAGLPTGYHREFYEEFDSGCSLVQN